jgi:hypothetical protein
MLRAMVAGCALNWKLGCSASGPRARLKGKGEGELKRGFSILKNIQTMNSNKSLNSNTQK